VNQRHAPWAVLCRSFGAGFFKKLMTRETSTMLKNEWVSQHLGG
jgi:hypothetical protein